VLAVARLEKVMKKTLIVVASLAAIFISVSVAAGTYWQVRCSTEDKFIGNYLTQDEAQHWAKKHSLETGHTTTTTPMKN
jgi:hypothetical protein